MELCITTSSTTFLPLNRAYASVLIPLKKSTLQFKNQKATLTSLKFSSFSRLIQPQFHRNRPLLSHLEKKKGSTFWMVLVCLSFHNSIILTYSATNSLCLLFVSNLFILLLLLLLFRFMHKIWTVIGLFHLLLHNSFPLYPDILNNI